MFSITGLIKIQQRKNFGSFRSRRLYRKRKIPVPFNSAILQDSNYEIYTGMTQVTLETPDDWKSSKAQLQH